MIKKRIIPVVLLRHGQIVQSRRFSRYNVLGNPTAAVERISNWSSDELVYLDISDRDGLDFQEDDEEGTDKLVRNIAASCSVPLTFGGGLRTIADIGRRIRLGADKVTLNTAAWENGRLIEDAATVFGSQCVVISIDVKKSETGQYEVYRGGRTPTGRHPVDWAREMESRGAGEILLNSMERDGTGNGYDILLIHQVCEAVSIPVIAMGGAGGWEHFAEVLNLTSASAVAAANIFQHSENSVFRCREFLFKAGFVVRKPSPLSSESAIL